MREEHTRRQDSSRVHIYCKNIVLPKKDKMINLKSPQQTLFRPRYTHACQEKSNPSRDPVPLSRKIIGKDKRIMDNFKGAQV